MSTINPSDVAKSIAPVVKQEESLKGANLLENVSLSTGWNAVTLMAALAAKKQA